MRNRREQLFLKKITVIGLFCENTNISNGQSVKTRIVTQELEKALGEKNVARIDTFGWKKNPTKKLPYPEDMTVSLYYNEIILQTLLLFCKCLLHLILIS